MTRRIVAIAILLVVVVVAFTYPAYHRDITQARARISTGSEVVETACGPIEYAVVGEGPPVLMVHGAGGGFDQGLHFGTDIAARGFRVIAMSRFGYLRTPLPEDASPAAQADAHACLLDALKLPRAAIIGGSAGAPSSMQFALRHPKRCQALVLLVPLAYSPAAGPASSSPLLPFIFNTVLRWDFLFWTAVKLAPDTLVKTLLATPPERVKKSSPQEQARVQHLLAQILPVSPRRRGMVNDGAVAESLERYDLEKITAPTLAISVEDDLFGTYAGARYSAEHIPGARFVGFPEGGHVWVGHHGEVVGEIAFFLKSAGG